MFIRVKQQGQLAMTLVEFMVSIAVGSVAIMAVTSLAVYTSRSFAAITNYVDLEKNSRKALDRMTRVIREADGVLRFTTNSVVLSYGGKPVDFTYVPLQKKVFFNNGTNREPLLSDCEFLKFDLYQRNPIEGEYGQYPSSLQEDDAKIVQVSWRCSRFLIGKIMNTESVQSAKIVIRKP